MDKVPWNELLDQLVYREGLSRPQISRRAGVNTKTIASWLRGDVRKPRRWQPLARVLGVLQATPEEVDRVLLAAGHRPVAALAARANRDDAALLAGWLAPDVPFMAPDHLERALVGRHVELTQLRQALRNERRAAVWGMGGVGKTTLAVYLAHELRQEYADGVFWGDMRGSRADAVLESWGQACGTSMRRLTDFHSRAAHMRGLFSQKQALIILDDVIDGRQALQMIPSRLSNCAVLVTTRSADVAHTITRYDQALITSLRPFARGESHQLFVSFLGEKQVATQKSAANRVAALLGDLPLALQISAALCADSGLTLQRMADLLRELSNRLEPLRLEQGALVRLAFEQSWELLDDETRHALAALAVFEGRSFDVSVFAACASLDENQAILLLTRLSRRSLLQSAESGRYRQHPLLAAFSVEKLGQDDTPWRLLVRTYHDRLQEAGESVLALQDEWGNVMAAMRAAHRLQEWKLLLAYELLLQPLWQKHGLYTLAREGSAWALAAARAEGDGVAQARIHLNYGLACLEQSDYELAQQHLHKAISLFQELDMAAGAGDGYYHLSRVALAVDDFDAAEEAVQTAWRHYQQIEDLPRMGRALYRLGNVHFHRGSFGRALRLAQDAIRWQQDAGDDLGQLRSQMLAASSCLHLDEVQRAQEHCRQAERLAQQVDDPVETSVFYYTYADLCRFQRQFDAARQYARRALALYRQMQDRFSEANALNLLAGIEVRCNDAYPQQPRFDVGLDYCKQGLALCEALDYSLGKAMLLLMRGRLLAQKNELADACEAWHQSLIIARELGHERLPFRLQELIEETGCAQDPS